HDALPISEFIQNRRRVRISRTYELPRSQPRSRAPKTFSASPASTSATPTHCNEARPSLRKIAPLASPDTGMSSPKGEMSAVGYLCSNRAQEAKPNSVAPHASRSTEPQTSALADAIAGHTAKPPSNAKDKSARGS